MVQWSSTDGTKGALGRFDIMLFERQTYWHYVIWANKTIMVKEQGFTSLAEAKLKAESVAERLSRDCQMIEKNILATDEDEDEEGM